MVVFLVMMPFHLVDGCHHVRWTCCLDHQDDLKPWSHLQNCSLLKPRRPQHQLYCVQYNL